MSNFRKFISMSAVAILGVTNLLTPLSYANAADVPDYDAATNPISTRETFGKSFSFIMPAHDVYLYAHTEANHYFVLYSGTTKTSGEMADSEYIYDLTGSLSGNQFTKLGYTFQNWKDGSGNTYPDQADVFNWTTEESGKVSIYAQWSANGYDIDYDLNDNDGGTSTAVHPKTPTSGTYDTPLTIVNPTRTGYQFTGWNITNMDSNPHTVGGEDSSAETASGVMGTSFKNLRATTGTVHFLAKWTPNPDTDYNVEHYLEKLEGGYSGAIKIDHLSGTTDATVTPATHIYTGFTPRASDTPTSGVIKADGSTVFQYHYTRNSYDLTLVAGTGIALVSGAGTQNTAGGSDDESVTISFKYEEPVTVSFKLKDGYQSGAWTGYSGTAASFTMGALSGTKTASATPIVYQLTVLPRGGSGAIASRTYTVEDENIPLGDPTRDHSTFLGWTGGVNGEEISSPTKGVVVTGGSINDREYSAVWSCVTGYHLENTGASNESCEADTNTKYLVNHIQQDLSGNYTIYIDTGYEYGTTNTLTPLTGKDYVGFELVGDIDSYKENIEPDGSTVVDIHYKRLDYAGTIESMTGVTNAAATGDNSGTSPFKYEDTVRLSATVEPGYTWSGWTVKDASGNSVTVTDTTPSDPNGATFQMPANGVTITPHVTRDTYTIQYELYSGHEQSHNPTEYTVESAAITLNEPARDHSVFEGWTGTDLTETTKTVIISKGSVGNRKYYAVWSCEPGYHDEGGTSCVANDYTVSVNYADDESHGSAETSIPFTYDQTGHIENPQQSGYDFAGWTITGLTSGATIDGVPVTGTTLSGVMGEDFKNLTTVSGGTVTFTATWTPRDDVKYVVHHYYENLSGTAYVLSGTDEYSGNVTVPVVFSGLVQNYSGWTYDNEGYLTGGTTRPTGSGITQVNIDKHGTTEIFLYYTRDTYHVYLSGDAHVNTLTGAGDYKYGANVEVDMTAKTGYHFVRWEKKSNRAAE